MSISLNLCSINDDGYIVEYSVVMNKGEIRNVIVGVLWFDQCAKRWKLVSDKKSLSLVEIAEVWSLLMGRLGLEKEE